MADVVYPATTGNLTIRSMYEIYQQMIEEIDKSLSKSTIGTAKADADRWLAYIAGIEAYITYYANLQQQDWPVTKGRTYALANPIYPDYEFKENIPVQDLIDMAVNARDELAVSASSSLPTQLYPADEARQRSYLDAMRGLITDYLLVAQPLDQPITSAKELVEGEGE